MAVRFLLGEEKDFYVLLEYRIVVSAKIVKISGQICVGLLQQRLYPGYCFLVLHLYQLLIGEKDVQIGIILENTL